MTQSYGSMRRETSPSDSDELDDRPTKRPRISSDYSPTQRRLMLEEVDLEIAMRERIASVLESRVTWALLLQKTLENSQSNVPWTIPGFQDSVMSALEVIEEPRNVLYTQDLRSSLVPPPTPAASVSTPTPSTVQEDISGTSTRRGASRRGTPAPRKKLLYLLNRTTQPPQVVKLACPDCQKTSFSSLQGLLNHCRLSHSREFGSHDECVQRCAMLVETEPEQAWVVANGSEVAGIGIPGLKRLFELAVGGGQAVVPVLSPMQTEISVPDLQVPPTPVPNAQDAPTLTQTLGHHIDTPALAPFLGRESKRRSIYVHDEESDVDVLNTEAITESSSWRMHYTHRNTARASLDEVVEPPETVITEGVSRSPTSVAAVKLPPLPSISGGVGSRFHITARVSIQDLSLWIPPTRRSLAHPHCTHKWRLAISSPSYSLSLSTFLVKLTITCLTDPPPTTFISPITLTKAPFVYTGITDRPFLSRLTFEWSGPEDLNPPMSIEHWVDLDPIHYSTAVLGEEQFFDVELDRHTEFLPEIAEGIPTDWSVEGAEDPGKIGDNVIEEEEPDYVVKLRSLLPRFPMTAKDVRGRSGPLEVPYTLVSTPSQLRNLVYGRRKAIEWSRAHAIQSAYNQLYVNSSGDHHTEPAVPLTTGDVFNWLEDEGLFSRKTKARPEEAPLGIKQKMRAEVKSEDTEAFCRYCGLHSHLHPTSPSYYDQSAASDAPSSLVKEEPVPNAIPPKPSAQLTCGSFQAFPKPTETPLVDVNRLIAGPVPSLPPTFQGFISIQQFPQKAGHGHTYHWLSRDLLSITPPQLVRAAAKFLIPPSPSVRAADFQETGNTSDAPQSLDNKPRTLVDDELAPAATLALVVKPLVKLLAKAGIDTYRRDEADLRGQGRRARRDIQVRRLLTPMHIVRGLQQEAQRDATASALLLVLSPLGMSLPPMPASSEDFYPAEDFR